MFPDVSTDNPDLHVPGSHVPQTPTWPHVVFETPGTCVAFGGNKDHRHQHRLWIPKHDPQCRLNQTSPWPHVAAQATYISLFLAAFEFFILPLSTTLEPQLHFALAPISPPYICSSSGCLPPAQVELCLSESPFLKEE